MPEGDTLFRTARTLHRALAGKPVTGFRSTYPLLTRFHDDTPLTGQLVRLVESRGKWLLIHFSGGATLATHMLMSGSWHIYRPGERWQKPVSHMRIILENADLLAIGFHVPVARMHTAQSLARELRIPNVTLDLLSPDFDVQAACACITLNAEREIADVLLDQHVLAGVGNEFKSEICFVCAVNPFARVASLSAEQIAALVAACQRLLRANVLEDSGDTLVTYRGLHRRTTHESDPGESVWVYGRAEQPCRRCGACIERRLQGPDARVTFWCPLCQPIPDGSDVDESD
ncbi:MAG TPA: DNA-formamidopyrimidine glycosylase family protein [Terracidiphilus sp.]|nr:DNA-formamidopyrimidine glycosylase family protein [Terracidiphilus sp.]